MFQCITSRFSTPDSYNINHDLTLSFIINNLLHGVYRSCVDLLRESVDYQNIIINSYSTATRNESLPISFRAWSIFLSILIFWTFFFSPESEKSVICILAHKSIDYSFKFFLFSESILKFTKADEKKIDSYQQCPTQVCNI